MLTVTGLQTGKTDHDTRRAALKKLTRSLSRDDVAALRLFLDSKTDGDSSLSPLEVNAIKNDVLDILLRQDELPDGLGAQLARGYRDTEHDEIWRDYCVQYLGVYYARRWPATADQGPVEQPHDAGATLELEGGAAEQGAQPKETSTATSREISERELIETAYLEALAETNMPFAATALLGLERLSRAAARLDRQRIGDAAVAFVTAEQVHEACKITGLRVCALMEKVDALPAARVIAQTAETAVLRAAAIATIGDLGDENDVELLQSLATSSKREIREAAEAGLKSLLRNSSPAPTEERTRDERDRGPTAPPPTLSP